MFLFIRSLSLLTILLIALTACGASPAAQSPTAASTIAPPTAAPTMAPTDVPTVVPTTVPTVAAVPDAITVTDDLGRTVTLEVVPQRIVSLAPSVTELLFAVGAGPQVVGVTTFCNYPPEADSLPEIGGFSASSISLEVIVGLQPDLVIAGSARQQAVAEQLEQLGVPVVIFAPASFEAVYASILRVGALTGHNDEAEQVVASMQARIAAVLEAIPDDGGPTVYWEVIDDPMMTTGPNTFIGQMITLVGATNIFADTNEDYPTVSPETVFARDPQVILGPDSHGEFLTVAAISERPGWADLQAVRDGRVYTLDGNIVSRPGPRLADAVELLAATLYPELFGGTVPTGGWSSLHAARCHL
ncbi:ABC transporter substrate-binding protein [Candidatus Chloroploca asiatica]|uniref:Cobalamin-binding protein n=1 Tax=Candidatus Chloroploca asiatica TaxID=1506545 RepID=A0A2H3L378_9CHLR|nr:ABC transporter substrate-binding protein [Candidatus Chloroploca asiatica]PDV99232.1 cobalamin-binding protein [Candidatus Chloroploca asiatica]